MLLGPPTAGAAWRVGVFVVLPCAWFIPRFLVLYTLFIYECKWYGCVFSAFCIVSRIAYGGARHLIVIINIINSIIIIVVLLF